MYEMDGRTHVQIRPLFRCMRMRVDRRPLHFALSGSSVWRSLTSPIIRAIYANVGIENQTQPPGQTAQGRAFCVCYAGGTSVKIQGSISHAS